MFLLEHVKPENASGRVKEAYAAFPAGFPVPEPLVLMSVSPELAYQQSQIVRHFMTHSNLDMGLLASIRYVIASQYDYAFCVNFNANLLKMAGGLSDEDLQTLKSDPESAGMEEPQKALLLFALKVVRSPEAIEKADVDRLREMGWSDQDIFDAAFHASSMVSASNLYKAFVK